MERRVSVIVPVYNLKKYLGRCIDSLINQSFRELEIILVDDGSTDGSGEACDEYALKDSRIRVIHKENGGLISAWKRGVEESAGRYISFVDGDDWIELNCMEDMLVQTVGEGKEIISCDYVIEREKGGEAVYQELPPGVYEGKELKEQVLPQLLGNERRKVCLSRCMKLITRELIEDNAKYAEPFIKMGEDVTVMLPALLDCDRLVIMNRKTYYHYFYHRASMVHRYDKGLFDNINLLKEIINKILTDKLWEPLLTEMKKQADKEYIFLLMLVLKNEIRGNGKKSRKTITDICQTNEAVRKAVAATPVKVQEKANKLIYGAMKKPNLLTISLLRLAMKIYDMRK